MSGGSLGTKVTVIIKTADQTVNNSTVLVDDDDLSLVLKANTRYAFVLYLRYVSPVVAGIDLTFEAIAGTTYADFNDTENTNEDAVAFGTETARQATGNNELIIIMGFVKTGAGGGTLQLQWAQTTATVGDTKVLEGTTLLVYEE